MPLSIRMTPTSRQHFQIHLQRKTEENDVNVTCRFPVHPQVLTFNEFCLLQAPGSANMTTIGEVVRKVIQTGYHPSTDGGWVTMRIKRLVTLGSPDCTYTGCAKPVFGSSGCPSWPCKKRVSKDDHRPDETLNYNHVHEGPCSKESLGIHCYALSADIADESGSTTVQIYAPAKYVLGICPSAFVQLNERAKADTLSAAFLKTWRMHLMTSWGTDGGQVLKVLWVERIPGQQQNPFFKGPVPGVSVLPSSMVGLVVSNASQVEAADEWARAERHTSVIKMLDSDLAFILDGFTNDLPKVLVTQERIRNEVIQMRCDIEGILTSIELVRERMGLD